MAVTDDYLIDPLIDMGMLNWEQVEQARLQADEASGEGVIDVLLRLGMVGNDSVLRAKASQFGAEVVDLKELRIPDEVLSMVPRNIARKYKVVPVSGFGDSVTIAISDPSDLDTVDSLHHLLKKEITVAVASEEDLEAAINNYYGGSDDSVGKMIQDITQGEVDVTNIIGVGGATDDGVEVDADAPLIKLVNSIIVDAFKSRASDIHLEPLEKKFRVRFRIDGMLQEVKSPPKRLQASIISRLKIQSAMSIDERRKPQDGRINLTVAGKQIDLRVNCLPTNHGESIVMRILDKSGLKLGLAELGFLPDDQQSFERMIGLPDGIILVTGPTGSGKTTTLYSCLNYINRPDRKIITVEDPVEYQLAGINQVQVNNVVGLTFAQALRAMLRQAPNVIMLGEIRDKETATIAINASLTGHLVFSTLHTNDAPGAVTRLVDIGVKPFLVATATRGIMAQRLVRKICKKCGTPREMSDSEWRAIGVDPSSVTEANVRMGAGCKDCNGGGYRGRFGIFEIFVIEDEARKLIYDQVPNTVLRARALEMGMRSLRDDGARKVISGLTSPEEVIRATVADAGH